MTATVSANLQYRKRGVVYQAKSTIKSFIVEKFTDSIIKGKPIGFLNQAASEWHRDFIPMQDISERFKFSQIVYFRRTELGDGYIMLEHEPSGISAAGEGFQDAKTELAMTVEMLWQNYALEDDDMLTEDAQQLKRWLLRNVRCRG